MTVRRTALGVLNWAATTGRLQDQLSNPEYAALRAQQTDPTNADPYRLSATAAPHERTRRRHEDQATHRV